MIWVSLIQDTILMSRVFVFLCEFDLELVYTRIREKNGRPKKRTGS